MEVLKTLEHLKHGKQQFADLNPVVTSLHSPSCSETSLFSTVDCSSFSSRSDASSFAKDENSPVNPSICVSVSSSIDFIPPSARLAFQEVIQDTVLKNGLSPGESGYFEFSFAEGQLLEQGNSSVCLEVTKVVDPAYKSSPGKQDDSYETFPVWTDRTRYCSKDVHSCINPCFDGDDAEVHARTSRKKKLARSLGSVISKHLVPSPGPTFRRSSFEKFRSRLALDHPSPVSEKLVLPPTPARTFESREKGYSSSPSPGYVAKYMNSPRLSFVKEKTKPTKPSELSASTSGKISLYGTSPRRGLQSKSLGCLRGISAAARAVVPTDESSSGECKGPLYFATEESVHGGKGRCLLSPRLSFSPAKTASKDESERVVLSMSTQVPSGTAHGHLHCVVKNSLPSFVFLVDGLDEVLIAKALRPDSPDRLEAGELVYMFYTWKPKGRAKANWKHWGRKDRPTPDLLGKMTLTSRVVPSETKDGDDSMELEFVLSQGGGSCSPRLSFSTWETGLSPRSSCNNKSPSPAVYGFPSPISVVSPSPGRLPPAASSRYVSMSMVPASLTSPRVRKPDPRLLRSSKKSLSSSPLRPKSDDEKSCFHDDAWSDCESTEAPEVREQSEVEALIIRIPGGRSGGSWESLSQQWASKSTTTLGSSMQSSRKSSYYRRFSLPGRFQAAETKENEEENKCRKTPSVKLRELMGVKSEFGKDEGSSGLNRDQVSVTVVLPAGNHGLPRFGAGGPQPLVDRWRAGGRCDCGSWDLGCGLTILQDSSHDQHQQQQDRSEKNVVKFFLQGKVSSSSTLRLGAVMDGLFPVSFEAPMSYLQAFGGAVAVIYSRGPRVLECGSSNGRKPPRVPLKPLTSQRRTVALAGYCSPPPACLLDRL